MPAFLLFAAICAAGCVAFVGALAISIGDYPTLSLLLRVALGFLAIAATNIGILFACGRIRLAVKRPAVVANAMLATLLLLFLQNKAMVGQQEIQVEPVKGDGATYTLTYRDLAGVPVEAGAYETQSLAKRLAGDEFRDEVALSGPPSITSDHKLVVTLADAATDQAFRDRVTGKPFHRPNPARDLFAVAPGIDLRGGVEFICQLYNDLGRKVAADDEVLHILRNRLDQRGLTEPTVTRLSNGDVQIVIPGGTPADAARTRKVIEQTGRLEFREVLEVYEATIDTDEQGRRQVTLPPEVRRREGGGYDLAAGARGNRKQVVAVDKTRDPTEQPTKFYKLGPAELTGKDVKDASRTLHNGKDAVSIGFTAAGGARNYEFTRRLWENRQEHQDQEAAFGVQYGRLAILFDGKVESAPVVETPSNNTCVISGTFTPEEIDSLKSALKGGSLSVSPVVLSERVVGATLGLDTVRRAVTTMLWSFIGILAFMGIYYRRLGIVAVLCMLITAGLIWSTLSVFGAVMTLPGLAGLVLSVAMSMDTNVLVYERIREEMRSGKDLSTAIDLGYSRAFLAILDSNLTTILSGLILFWIGSGPVKGFGLTLAVGVAVSMFSGVYIGRMITEMLCRGREKVSMAGMIPEPRLPYVRWRRISYALSFVTGILGLAYFLFGHLLVERGSFNRNFDIDFTGGNMVQVIFREPLAVDRVQDALGKAWSGDPERFGLLDPAEMAPPQPYFSSLAGGASSRQWVFRGRDEVGAGLEGQRADLERERGGLQRKLDAARDPEHLDEDTAKQLEPQIRDLTTKIVALEDGIAKRVAVFKERIAEAFPGQVPVEGSEVLGASWAERTLTLRLSTLEAPGPAEISRLAAAIARRSELAEAKASALAGETGFEVVATYREQPAPAVIESEDAIGTRLRSLLAAQAGDRVGDVAHAAHELYQGVVQAAAGVGLTVAQPYPASQHFSGQVAGAMKRGALIALTLATLAMLAYIAARFEVGFGIAAMVAMAHDILLTLGLISLFGLRIDLTVVAALLTIIGYSVNDTIVTFDRIRENLKLMSGKSLADIIDLSVAQTMPRTILTGGATILAIIFMMLFAGDAIFAFNATLLIGTLLGTYSSIFVAAPLLLAFDRSKLVSPEPDPAPGEEEPRSAEPVPS